MLPDEWPHNLGALVEIGRYRIGFDMADDQNYSAATVMRVGDDGRLYMVDGKRVRGEEFLEETERLIMKWKRIEARERFWERVTLALSPRRWPVGTKSLLYGAHCFWLHPAFVFVAWWKLYGFPWDPRLWLVFLVHDWGYWGKPNMDGPEGEDHTRWAADMMSIFDGVPDKDCPVCQGMVFYAGGDSMGSYPGDCGTCHRRALYWYELCLYHSRFVAKRDGRPFSQLCAPDKLAVALEPWWLYLPRAIASGEVEEYMARAREGKYASMNVVGPTRRQWFANVQEYLLRWVAEHADGRDDEWTGTR